MSPETKRCVEASRMYQVVMEYERRVIWDSVDTGDVLGLEEEDALAEAVRRELGLVIDAHVARLCKDFPKEFPYFGVQ